MTAQLEKSQSETYDEWGSLITAAPANKLKKKDTPSAQNVFPDEIPGAIITAPGFTKVGDLPSGNPCRWMYTFRKSDGSELCPVSTMKDLYELVKSSEKVLTF